MKDAADRPPAQPFFLAAAPGNRFCVYHAPAPERGCRGAILYVHPFAEEMNKARRMAALQARALAAQGCAVLQVDLFGCGDSDGDFGDARWEIWKRDLAAARQWLERHVAAPLILWGLRIGALLALDFAREQECIERILLWQPVLSGEPFITRFLRLRIAERMLAASPETTVAALRRMLAGGAALDIAGYTLAPALAAAIDSLDAGAWRFGKTPLHWFEVMPDPARPLAPAAAQVAQRWLDAGIDLQLCQVRGAPFWTTQEITDCPELLSATAALFDGAAQ